MTKLSDTQAVLLATAAKRATLSLLPFPATLKTAGAGNAIAGLITCAFAEEYETSDSTTVHRTDGDLRYGVYATPAGLAAVGIEPEVGAEPTAACPAPKPARTSKTDSVLTLLRRPDGATLSELIAVTRMAAAHGAGGPDRAAQEGPCDRARQAR